MLETKTIVGTPLQIGSGAFAEMLMPVIREASLQMDPASLVQVYSGILCAAYGSLEADFGKDFANAIVRKISESYIVGAALDGGGLTQ